MGFDSPLCANLGQRKFNKLPINIKIKKKLWTFNIYTMLLNNSGSLWKCVCIRVKDPHSHVGYMLSSSPHSMRKHHNPCSQMCWSTEKSTAESRNVTWKCAEMLVFGNKLISDGWKDGGHVLWSDEFTF